ncbi:ParA family protein [Aneurinibacillus terranovensis]|uniref:ParA family protein n=1 Tax=Aneurinibacillus terranovensis TaxID=278991 RepID=UPI000417EF4D|nr:ParA family protein [Aneurinibacillus terranovensis]
MANIEAVLRRYDSILSGNTYDSPLNNGRDFKTFVMTNFRGGIGKTTLSFNIAYKFTMNYRTLLVDVCPQRNFSELLLDKDVNNAKPTIYDALLDRIMGVAWKDASEEMEPLSRRVKDTNREFDGRKISHVIPGSNELFLFPSTLYTQLNQFYAMGGLQKTKAVGNLLNSLDLIIKNETNDLKTEKVLIDSSPFFGGATHLAWMAADALIIPVRVDEQSLFALELTLKMLHDDSSDFNMWRQRAGIDKKPKIQAIALTHCGWNRQAEHQIDGTSLMFIERAVEIANNYVECFSTDNPIDHFSLLSDFQSSGKISGSLGIPIDKLEARKFHTVEKKRLQVNKSVERYKRELDYLFKLLD